MVKMKYFITEQQNDRLKRIMFHVFDSYLTPSGGWEPKEYQEKLNDRFSDKELFISLENSEDNYGRSWEETEHMLYSSCDNPNYNYKRNGDCPEVIIPDNTYDIFDDSFGKKVWRPYFFEWFEKNSGLPIVRIRKFAYT